MESVLFLLAAGKIHSIRLLQDISCHVRGIPMHKLQGIAEAEKLWCAENDKAVYPFTRVLAWLRFYHWTTRKRLDAFEARGLVRRRRPNRAYNACDAYVLTKLGHRYVRMYWSQNERRAREYDNMQAAMA